MSDGSFCVRLFDLAEKHRANERETSSQKKRLSYDYYSLDALKISWIYWFVSAKKFSK